MGYVEYVRYSEMTYEDAEENLNAKKKKSQRIKDATFEETMTMVDNLSIEEFLDKVTFIPTRFEVADCDDLSNTSSKSGVIIPSSFICCILFFIVISI